MFLTYMNGVHPVSGIRIAGNIAIGLGLIEIIVHSYIRPKCAAESDIASEHAVP